MAPCLRYMLSNSRRNWSAPSYATLSSSNQTDTSRTFIVLKFGIGTPSNISTTPSARQGGGTRLCNKRAGPPRTSVAQHGGFVTFWHLVVQACVRGVDVRRSLQTHPAEGDTLTGVIRVDSRRRVTPGLV